MKKTASAKTGCPHCEEYRNYANYCGKCGKQLRDKLLSEVEIKALREAYASKFKYPQAENADGLPHL